MRASLATGCYVIEAGEAEVVVHGFPIGRLGAGAGFGERALLRNVLRAATVRALTPPALLAFDRAAFLYAVTGRLGEELGPARARAVLTGPDPRPRTVPDLRADQAPFTGLTLGALKRLASAATVEHHPAERAGQICGIAPAVIGPCRDQ